MASVVVVECAASRVKGRIGIYSGVVEDELQKKRTKRMVEQRLIELDGIILVDVAELVLMEVLVVES